MQVEKINIVDKHKNRNAILSVEKELKKVGGAWIGTNENRDCPTCPLTHTFSDGIYLRELFIPAGNYIVGEIHIHDHPVFLMEGEIIVITEEGRKDLKAPNYFISPPGTKRLALTVTDTKWITVHANPTNERDLIKIEELNIVKDFEEYDKLLKSKEAILLTQ